MSTQKLSALEREALAGLADKAALAAPLLEAWSDLPPSAPQSARSLVRAAQLGVTEEAGTQSLLDRMVGLHLAVLTPSGFVPASCAFASFGRLAFALHSVDHYRSLVHRDETIARVVLTRPPRPSALEQKLSALGWRTTDLEATEHAFHSMVRAARRRVVVMTPFFDSTGAAWLQELLSFVAPGVERVLILRSFLRTQRRTGQRPSWAVSPSCCARVLRPCLWWSP